MLFSVGVTLLSAAVGLLPGVADTWRTSGFGGDKDQSEWTAYSSMALLVAGGLSLARAVWRWRERQWILDARGTAYVVEEQATYWVHEEKVATLHGIAANFAQVLRVPGPAALDPGWAWSTEPERLGHWDQRVDELVSAFRAVHYNDDQVSHNAVFMWAPWPVALAFGARVTAGVRGLTLHVRQRPSFGTSAAPRPVIMVEDKPHDFQHADVGDVSMVGSHTVAPVSRGVISLRLACADPVVRPRPGEGPSVRLLMVGVNAGTFRGLAPTWADPAGDATATPLVGGTATIAVPAELAQLLPELVGSVPCARWHLASPTTADTPIPDLEWTHFPSAAAAIANWLCLEAAEAPDAVHLLVCRAPQELLLGVGIISSQPSHGRPRWPDRLYPVVYADGSWSVPNVRLAGEPKSATSAAGSNPAADR